jgi:hypothetical protein
VQELLAFRIQSGSNPWEIRRQTIPFFFPLSVEKHGNDFMQTAPKVHKKTIVNDDTDEDEYDDNNASIMNSVVGKK